MTTNYVLATAAYNEDKFIEATIRSVIAQTIKPLQWVIVSDGSVDRTDAIVKDYANRAPFIRLLRIDEDHARNFAAQAMAINRGMSQLHHLNYDYIGNLDADITFEPDYFERLLAKLNSDTELGLAGGWIVERGIDEAFYPRRGNSQNSVPHGCQFFRRACFEAVGGAYVALPYGGPDTYAEVAARMRGWRVKSFEGLPAYHHRPTNAAGGMLKGCFRQGRMDYSLGTLPSFEFIKLANRSRMKPYVLGAAVRYAGFVQSYLRREKRAVPNEFMSFLRNEQRERVMRLLGVFRKGKPAQSGAIRDSDHVA